MAEKIEYPHVARPYETKKGHVGTYCLNDGQVWPCATAQRRHAQKAKDYKRVDEVTHA